MTRHVDRRVVAGVDGTPAGLAAARLAAVEAALRGVPLNLIAAHRPPPDDVRRMPDWTPETTARRWLAAAADAVRAACPHVPTGRELRRGELAEVIISASFDAGLVVVGNGGAIALADRVAAHAATPVMVASAERGHSDGPVMVGVDGTKPVPAALDFAFDEAALRGVPVVATYVWSGIPDTNLSSLDPFAYDVRLAAEEADRVIAEALAGMAETYPDVPLVRQPILDAHAGKALVAQAGAAALLVVAARSAAGRSDLLLGAVTRHVLHHASCPVVVIR